MSYMVFALDAKTGKHRLGAGGASRPSRLVAGIARIPTPRKRPSTDGERVYASFGGNVGVFCYSLDGKLLWEHTWPPQPIYLDFGTASSPVVHEGRVYQLHDNDGGVVPGRARRKDRQRALECAAHRRDEQHDIRLGDAIHLGEQPRARRS